MLVTKKQIARSSSCVDLLWFSIVFGVFYWILESVRDVLIFERGNLINRLFFPDSMTFWMRFLVVCIILLFGAIARSQNIKIEKLKKERFHSSAMYGPLKAGVAVGMLYWVLESFRDVIVFEKGGLLERIFTPDPMSLWMRLLAVFIILLFTIYAQALINDRQKAEENLKKEQEQLEKMVEERTNELTKSNRLLRRLREEMAERVRVEEALQKSEKKYRTLTENINIGIYRNTPGEKGIFLEVNPCLVRMFGYESKEELMEIHVSDLYLDPEDSKTFNKKILTNRFVKDEEVRLKKKDGSCIWGSVTATVVRDDDGNVIYYDGVIEDITKRRQMEAEIERRKKYLEHVLHNAPNGIVTADMSGIITEWNPGAEQIFEYSRHETIGLSADDLIGNDEVKDEMALITRQLKSGTKVLPLETVRYKKDGKSVDVIVAGSPIRIGGELCGFVAVYTDISELKEAERAKAKIQAQLIQAQKMEAIGILAGGIAHDFNNLMTAILGCADMAMMELNEKDSVYKDLKEIRVSAERAADLTRQLLLFSRKQPMKFRSVNLNAVIQDLLSMLRRLIGENIQISTDLEADLWTLGGDRGGLEQVIMNLAVNARDAMPDGGQLTIKTENVLFDKHEHTNMSEARPGRFVRICVSDTGAGMDKETIRHIFDPFFSTKTIGKGTGLGLSVIYGIVKQHEGWINVTSVMEQGSTFDIYLPLGSTEPEEKVDQSVPVEELVGEGKKVLVVEDEEKVREFTTSGLNRNGYLAISAADAEEAMDIYKREKGQFHMVLSDVGLPGRSGIDMIADLQSFDPNLRVLLISGYTDHESRWPKIKENGYHFLEKPYTLNDLLRVVQEVVETPVMQVMT